VSNIPDNSRPDRDSLRIDIIVDENVTLPLHQDSLLLAAREAAADRGYDRGEIGIRVTSDRTIHQLNREYLGHDYPTDVISFAYHVDQPTVEGELAVSADIARERATDLGWPAAHELILYVVHGTLHITGMDDHDHGDRAEMRTAEQRILMHMGIDDILRFGADQKGTSLLEGPA
jgi:probable rRNA maturation factor